jgi:DNA helicase IV
MSSKFTDDLNKAKSKWKLTVIKETRDYSKEEFFLKKKALAEAMIEKHGLPDEEMINKYLNK